MTQPLSSPTAFLNGSTRFPWLRNLNVFFFSRFNSAFINKRLKPTRVHFNKKFNHKKKHAIRPHITVIHFMNPLLFGSIFGTRLDWELKCQFRGSTVTRPRQSPRLRWKKSMSSLLIKGTKWSSIH